MAATLVEDAVRRLSLPELDPKVKVDAATGLRDSLDHYTTVNIYPQFLKRVMPVFVNILRGNCVFQSAAPEQKLRNCILEILHRLPTNPAPVEPFEPYAEEVVDLLMTLVRTDNEDNATLCVKIISDIMRHQHKIMIKKVQPFLNLIQELFQQMERVVKEQLDSGPGALQVPGAPSTPGSTQTSFQQSGPGSPVAPVPDFDQQQTARPLLRGIQSFKVLSECPIIVVSIFQVYRNTVPQNVKAFVPLIKLVLCLQAKAQEQEHANAAAKGTIFAGVSPEIKNRAAFGEFITAQVKTMSFLAYLLRQYSQQLTDFLPTLPDIVVRLLKDCPRERSGARKELLVAIRHIINFNFRKIFLPKIDELLEERTLIGDGLTVYETMRPLAYSMLADLIHHVRDNLTPAQIRKTVEVYTKNLQDTFPGTSFQTMSAKLLLNMAECIAKLPNKMDARHYLIMILNAIGDKFAAMNRQYNNSVKLSNLYSQQTSDGYQDTYLADKNNPPNWDEVDIFSAMPIKTANPRDRGTDPVVDNKFLFRNLMNGLKNTFYQLKFCNPGQIIDPSIAPQHWQDVSYGFTAEEVQVVVKLFREGAYVFRYYEADKATSDAGSPQGIEMANLYMISSGKEEKELLETFATVFHCIDPATFHEVFQQEMPRLYDMIFEHHALLHIPQFFLASEATSPSFCGMLLRFLMDRIEDIGSADVKKSSILLRLFKLAFMAVTLFASQNEQVLLPHVLDIVTKSIELSTRAEEPMNYFLLLRSLFRSIGGGKFEHLYKQILPLLEMLLDVLNNLLLAARKPIERDLYVELCLTVPARLSNLLPHLSYLMRPLVVALRAGTELVGQGLRTLELCVDNLTADYLDPIMAPVIDDLMTALFEHLKPHPYSHFHAHTTMRILGKLGGRNRKFMTDALPVTFQQYVDDRSSVDLRLIGSKKDRAFPVDIGVDLAIQKLMEAPKATKGTPSTKQSDSYYNKHALHLIKTQLKLRIGFDHLPDELPRLVRLQAQDLLSRKTDADFSAFEASDRSRSIAKKEEQDQVLKRLIKALFYAESMADFKDEADAFLMSVCRHFTILEVGRGLFELKRATHTSFDVNAGEGPLCLDTRVLSDAILESLASEHPDVRAAAQRAIREVFDTAATIFGSEAQVGRLHFFTHLASAFCHGCYEEEWFTKMGGTLGIHTLLTDVDLGDAWVSGRQMDFIRSLMHVIKDMPQDLPEKTRRSAQTTLDVLLERVTKNIKKEDVLAVQGQPGQPPPKQPRLAQVCHALNMELSHMNRHVRETAKRSLDLIAKAADSEVWELIEPYKDRLLSPIYGKPLRALPFAVQIGYIDAVTYYMTLKSDFVPFDEHLNRLLMESLALADASDESLANKPGEFRTHEFIVSLRVSCIKILKTAMAFDEFMKGSTNPHRTKIVSVFFKCLYQEPQPTIEAATDALKGVLAPTNKLPKDLLQSGLRPVLASLQNPKQLTTHGLDNLARLLRLLTSYFKVEIGSRLLDHTKVLVDPNTLQQISFTFFEQHPTMKVIASVFNIFHLLPPLADVFIERVIDTVLGLEEKLRRTHCSPFRAPLYKYLNRYPNQVWTLLVGRIDNIKYGRFLAQLLRDVDSHPLREHAAGHVEDVRKACSAAINGDRETKFAAVIEAINVVDALSRFPDSSFWMEKKEHLVWLRQIGRDLERQLRGNVLPPELRLAANQAGEQLVSILTKSLSLTPPKDLDPLFSLIDSVTNEDFRLTQDILSYIYKNIICNDSIEFWKVVVLRCLEVYVGKAATQKSKRFLLHYIVNPIVAMDVMRHWNQPEQGGPRLMDRTVIESINNKIWKVNPGDPQEDLQQPGIDHTRMEVLQLTAMLVKYHHANLQDARKDIIKFGWTYIRLDDVINKHAAHVVIGYFIAHYETPAKIVTQIYFSLLKTNQNEGRVLVTQALELMAPVLPKRCHSRPDDRNAVWAVAPRRILSEEGQNLQQISSIFQFLVKHPYLFYDSRDKFAILIIQSLRKVAAPPNPSNESKRLALNMMWLIWQWECRRVEGKETGLGNRALSESPASKKRKLDALEQQPTSSPPATRTEGRVEYGIPQIMRQKMIRFLVEFIAQLHDRYVLPSAKPREATPAGPSLPPTPTDLCKKAIALLYNLLQPQYWGDLEFDLFPNVTEVILASDKTASILTADPADKEKYDDKFLTNIINTLQVVRIILNFKSDEWILKNMEKVQKVLDKCLKSENPELQDCLHMADPAFDDGRELRSTIKRVLDAVPVASDDVQMEDGDAEGESESQPSEVVTFLSNIATETMAAGNYVSGINIIWSLGNRDPSSVDPHIPALMKSLQAKLARDHVSHYTAKSTLAGMGQRPQDPLAAEMSNYDLEIQSGLILKAIEVTAKRMEILGDNRRPFLSVLATLVDKSLNVPLCDMILKMVESWVFRAEGTWPTLKEKCAVLHKMLSFEHRPDPTMLQRFLELVIRIYEDPKIAHSELTVRLEHAFLIGTRAQDVEMRNRFMAIFDKSLPRVATARLSYVIKSQNWDTLADSYWLTQATQLLLGAVELNSPIQLHQEDFRIMSASQRFGNYAKDGRAPTMMSDDKYDSLMAGHRRFVSELGDVRVRDLIEPLAQLQHVDTKLAHELWVAFFPMYWSATLREERSDLEHGLVQLLTKDYHARQIDRRPNVVQSMLEGAAKAWPECKMPPHVLKYEAKTYDAWYTALIQLENAAIKPEVESATVRESNLDALIELYSSLQEDDLFYGTWRRRCQFLETNSALSYEQNGMWDKAQKGYEAAQIKARTGVIPFSQAEYMLWEDHWVLCAQKLQQWDILQDFAKHENFQDLLLECAWRNTEMWTNQEHREALDNLIKGVMDAPTPRRAFFQAFMSLLKLHSKQETLPEFTRVCDEAIQLAIRKWHQLPRRFTNAHIPLLQNFQQLVELHDASVICASLASTSLQNLDGKSGELKLLLSAWRDRLPNTWDDITAWQDLVTWRQHIFGLINSTYLTLLPQGTQTTGGATSAYRGYHETAWIINRFAHVARKHNLPEVCVSQLSRIYTLPNIEIQEAFLKLREQAKCHYQNPDELTSGLEVINNTNLNYFTAPQKAEFYTLKGMFLEKLKQKDEADHAYGTALYFDITAAKAWAEWGYFNERRFKEDPSDLTSARQALTSYLQAAGSYKSAKARKLLSRILWLLSLDDAKGTIATGFDDCMGETPTWYWITFIPQLLTGLGHKEAVRVHTILLKIAKSYPQALYFQLRTSREDMVAIKKSQEAKEKARLHKAQQAQAQAQAQAASAAAAAAANKPAAVGAASKDNDNDNANANANVNANASADANANTNSNASANANGSPTMVKQGSPSGAVKTEGDASRPATANGDQLKTEGQDGQSTAASATAASSSGASATPATTTTAGTGPGGQTGAATAASQQQQQQQQPQQQQQQSQQGAEVHRKPPWELTEEIMSVLKTSFPLLALSMETMVDQIQKNFKCPPDEDAYRLIVALLNDGLAYVSRMPTSYAKDVKLPAPTETNITRFAETILPAHTRPTFEADFVQVKPTMFEYIQKLRKWRDKFEEKLDRRTCHANLESFSPHLSEFRYMKFDDVEVPGQYLQHKDRNQDFVRIERFLPDVDLVRTIGVSHRRLKIRGHDGSIHSFAVQHPAARHCRREERILQLFRGLNQRLSRKKEARRRDLQFTLPLMVPLAPHIRIVQEDTSYITLQGVYEDHCRRNNMSKDEPVLFTMEKLRGLVDTKPASKHSEQATTARLEVFTAIREKWVGHTVALDYFQRAFPDFAEFWLFRRRFSYQLGALTFMTYIMYIDKRYPHKINIARGSGNIWGSELMSFMAPQKPFFHNTEPVPFRLTPNLQTLMGPLATEGIFSCSIMAIARCLTEPEYELEHALTLFVRDEVMFWLTSSHRAGHITENQLREMVQTNSDMIVKRAVSLAQTPVGNLPANQTVIDLISKAVSPVSLAMCDALWMPYM